MNTHVRVWQSFSSNNSTGIRLVGRFETATQSSAAEAELKALSGDDFNQLADALGFEWGYPFGSGVRFSLAAEGNVLTMFQSSCLELPGELEVWLAKRGASVEDATAAPPIVSVVFAVSAQNQVSDELTNAFENADAHKRMPWFRFGQKSFFYDGQTLGFCVPIDPDDLAVMKQWLAERGVTQPTIRLCQYDDEAKFSFIAAARCSSCDGAMTYVEPKRFGLDAEQLACDACGAMYELSALRASSAAT